jgi:hypothetical protein
VGLLCLKREELGSDGVGVEGGGSCPRYTFPPISKHWSWMVESNDAVFFQGVFSSLS